MKERERFMQHLWLEGRQSRYGGLIKNITNHPSRSGATAAFDWSDSHPVMNWPPDDGDWSVGSLGDWLVMELVGLGRKNAEFCGRWLCSGVLTTAMVDRVILCMPQFVMDRCCNQFQFCSNLPSSNGPLKCNHSSHGSHYDCSAIRSFAFNAIHPIPRKRCWRSQGVGWLEQDASLNGAFKYDIIIPWAAKLRPYSQCKIIDSWSNCKLIKITIRSATPTVFTHSPPNCRPWAEQKHPQCSRKEGNGPFHADQQPFIHCVAEAVAKS